MALVRRSPEYLSAPRTYSLNLLHHYLSTALAAIERAEQVAHHRRNIAYRRDRARVRHARWADHAEYPGHLAPDAIAREHHAIFAHLVAAMLAADHHLHALA